MEISIDHFDLKQIADSGQCFRWKTDGESTKIIAFGKCLYVTQQKDTLNLSCSKEEFDSIWADYFDMSCDYNRIEELVKTSKDVHLIEAYKEGYGIRILKQDLFETIVSFIISQNNNIPRIKGSLEKICEKAGLLIEGSDEYRLPGPFDVTAGFFEDRNLSLGYRSEYLEIFYEHIRSTPDWLLFLKSLSYQEARKELLKLKGIGPKVADCICLFSLHHIDAFPIDTHVKQLLEKYYSDGFDFEHFNGYAGVIQQYLFYYELLKK